jgi:crotonobetainyl-CoA:carnitine CoA-transferase CaiB-like acyl-CoA transferase
MTEPSSLFDLNRTGPLAGVRILDLSRLLPGPACSWYLSEMGADVVCLEPIKGTPARFLPPLHQNQGSYFTALHGGKKSGAVRFRHPRFAETILKLAPFFDVFIEGFKPGRLEEIGLSPKQLHQVAPHLVIARLSGYGQTGPWAHKPGHDINYLSLAGALAGVPITNQQHALYCVQISDLSGALTGAMGINAALFEVERQRRLNQSLQGRVLDISLCESALALSAPLFYGLANQKQDPQVQNELLNGGLPSYRTYECADGKWMSLGALEPKFVSIVNQHLGSDPTQWGQQIKKHTLDYWLEAFTQACSAPVLSYADLINHPHHTARGSIAQDDQGQAWIRTPLYEGPLRPPPKRGQHTRSLLELCYTQTEINCLQESDFFR